MKEEDKAETKALRKAERKCARTTGKNSSNKQKKGKAFLQLSEDTECWTEGTACTVM